MNILVACEESQQVCVAFRNKGHQAFSCDIEPCSGNHPEWHINQDVIPLINGNCEFNTVNGSHHKIEGKWDMILAFPPCTHLAVSGARYFEQKRLDGRQQEGIEFFCNFLNADCDKIVIENPVNIISGNYIKQHFPELCEKYGLPIKSTQIIQPYEYGHPYSKKTCLWIKGLPNLIPTNIVEYEKISSNGKTGGYSGNSWHATDENGKILSWDDPRTAKERSKTYKGIADAMAEQWG